jgi:hypothetical protein
MWKHTEVTHLEHLREDLHNFTLLVAIQLNSVDECDLRLAAVAEWFEHLGELGHFPETTDVSGTLNDD